MIAGILNNKDVWLPTYMRSGGISKPVHIEDYFTKYGIVLPSPTSKYFIEGFDSGNLMYSPDTIHRLYILRPEGVVCLIIGAEVNSDHDYYHDTYTAYASEYVGLSRCIALNHAFHYGKVKTPKQAITKLRKVFPVHVSFQKYTLANLLAECEKKCGEFVKLPTNLQLNKMVEKQLQTE